MTRSCFLVYVVIVVVAVALAASPAFGQAESGTISGTVRDSTGAVIPGATVIIKNAGTSMQRTTQTGSLGQYSIAGLPTGNYAVTVASGSFALFTTTAEVTVGPPTTPHHSTRPWESTTSAPSHRA
jgi:Carboxypeptidase regulatory-like domain